MASKGKSALTAIAFGAALLTACAASVAQEGRFYMGGSLGQAKLNDFCSDIRDIVASVPGATVNSCDEKDSAWKIFGGYRVNRNFALEATYIDFGKVTASGQSFGVPFSAKGSATSFGAAAVGILPVAGQFSVFGKLGLLRTEGKSSASGVGGSFSESTSDTGLHLGFGAMFDLGRNFSIRAEWEREDENKIDMMSAGVQFSF